MALVKNILGSKKKKSSVIQTENEIPIARCLAKGSNSKQEMEERMEKALRNCINDQFMKKGKSVQLCLLQAYHTIGTMSPIYSMKVTYSEETRRLKMEIKSSNAEVNGMLEDAVKVMQKYLMHVYYLEKSTMLEECLLHGKQ